MSTGNNITQTQQRSRLTRVKRIGRGRAADTAKRQAAEKTDNGLARVRTASGDSKAARCRSTAACPNADLQQRAARERTYDDQRRRLRQI